MVRAKFVCHEVSESRYGGKNWHFMAVTDGSEENKKFWKWTPGGDLKLHCVNPEVSFELGKEYYLDISMAVVAAPVPAPEERNA